MAAASVRTLRAQDSLRPTPNDRLEIRNDKLKGRGVFAAAPIAAGTLIEAAPVIIVPTKDCPLLDQTILHDYYFNWDGDKTAMKAVRLRSRLSRCATIRAGLAPASGAISRTARSTSWRW